jgi:ABC-type lipoprotein release transport system permease subunit
MRLGVVPRADVPMLWIGAVVLLGLLLALIATALPARAATRLRPSGTLRNS